MEKKTEFSDQYREGSAPFAGECPVERKGVRGFAAEKPLFLAGEDVRPAAGARLFVAENDGSPGGVVPTDENGIAPASKNDSVPAGESGSVPANTGADPIAVLRVIAMSLVFLLHVKGFSAERGFDQSACGKLAFLFQAPAWGGVWIFFLLSGYLIGKGFFSGRYQPTVKGALRFYYKRWLKIGIPTYASAALISVFICPEFAKANPVVLLRILTFTYNGIPGVPGIGALWYISTLMWLYLLSPLAFILGKGLTDGLSLRGKRKAAFFGIAVLAAGGATFRFLMLGRQSAWYEDVYAPFWGNLDLYFCGFLTAFFAGKKQAFLKNSFLVTGKILSSCLLAAAIVFASFTAYYEAFYDFYIALCPTLFLLATGGYLVFFDILPGGTRAAKFTFSGWLKHPSLIVNGIAELSFEFYLLHSAVLATAPRFSVRSNVGIHLSLCLYAAVVTLACSIFFRSGLKLFSLPKGGLRLPKKFEFCRTSLKKWIAVVVTIAVAAGGISLWCAKTPYSGLSGGGTVADPYRISTTEDYLRFVKEVNAGKTFVGRVVALTADLDFGGRKIDPCGSTKTGRKFSGTLDGRGHIVFDFFVEGDDVFGYDIGLFGWIEDGAVYNLGLENGRVSGACVGAFVSAGRGKIINCYSNITLSGARTGAICDNFYGKIANCWSMSTFPNTAGAAGMVSYPATGIAVENCFLAKESLPAGGTEGKANLLSSAEMNGELFAAAMNAYNDFDLPLVRFVPGKDTLRFIGRTQG